MAAPLSRRQFIARASRAGLGVGALALAGCGSPEVFNARRANDLQDQPEAPALAAEQADEHEATEARDQAQSQTPSIQISAPPVSADLVDPLVWRERYHWRELAKLPGQNAGPVEGSSLHVHAPMQFSWTPFDPQGPEAGAGTFLPLIYSQLVVMSAGDRQNAHHGEIEGDLAAGWEVPEPTTLVFRIRRDVQWPDEEPLNGRMLTASDVRISHDAYRSPALPQRSAYQLVERIEADDDEMTVTFHLREPASYLLAKMTDPLHVVGPPHQTDDPNIAVISKSSWSPTYNELKAYGTGPFQFEYTPSGSWGMTRNPRYFKRDPRSGQRLPYLHRIRGGPLMSRTPRFFDRSELWPDWLDKRFHALELRSPSELDQSRELFPGLAAQVVAPTPGRGSGLRFWGGITGGTFADARIRHALSSAIDRAEVAKRTRRGLSAPDCGHDWSHIVDESSPSGFREWPWTPEELGRPYTFDPAYARSLLAAAGFSQEAPLELRMSAGGSDELFSATSLAEVATVADQWQTHLGPAVQMQLLPRRHRTYSEGPTQFTVTQPHEDAQITSTGRLREYTPDPDSLTYGRLHSSNNQFLRDPLLDDLCEQQRHEVDPVKRSEILEQIRQRDLEISWRLPLVNPYGLHARHADVFNVTASHIAHNHDYNPKQFERAWRLPPS